MERFHPEMNDRCSRQPLRNCDSAPRWRWESVQPAHLERIVTAMRDTKHEFGSIGADADELISGPTLDEDTRREVQLRRFRKQAWLSRKSCGARHRPARGEI